MDAHHTQVRRPDAHAGRLVPPLSLGGHHLLDGIDAHDGHSVAGDDAITQVPKENRASKSA